jgi:serine/threonine-protein kinase
MAQLDCADANMLQALAAGQLDDAAREALLEHADGCGSCRELVAAVARELAAPRTTPPPAEPVEAPAPPWRPSAMLAPGTMVGRYTIERLIGVGGLGVVYAATDPELARQVALKLLKRGSEQERLVREARALARVSHPNVVAVHDVGRWNDRVFIAMELVRGCDLRGWLRERRRRWPEVVDVFLAAGRGLASAHAAGLVHRDFKPENVLISSDGRVAVSDFGLARSDDEAADGTVAGTPAYMAPEQAAGELADARSDQFAFCASLFEALYGARLSERPDETGVPRTLGRIVRRGLAAAPAARWGSMAELLAALGRDRTRWPRRLAAAALAACAIVATALGVDWVARRQNVAVASASFAATGRALERALALRYETFGALADLSTIVPIFREVAGARDQAAFGLGSTAGDQQRLAALHASLRDADWDAWAATIRAGEVAIADYKGRLLYTTGAPDAYGADLNAVPAVAASYQGGAGVDVMRATDARLHAAGLGARLEGQLVLILAKSSVLAGVPQAALVQLVAARRLLADVATDPTVAVAIVTRDGTEGALPGGAAEVALRHPGRLTTTAVDGRRWFVQAHPVPGLAGGPPVAWLVMAEPADVGVAGVLAGVRPMLAITAALLFLAAAWGLIVVRRFSR